MPSVRPAQSSDLARIMEIAASATGAARWSDNEYAKLFAPETMQDRLVLVVEHQGDVQGFVIGRNVESELEIENIAVSSTVQKQGFGWLLLEEFLRVVRTRHGTSVFLEVRESNRPARLLYEKARFVEIGRRKSYYRDPPEDAVVLRFSFP